MCHEMPEGFKSNSKFKIQNAELLTSPTTILLISHKAPFSKYAYANNTHSKPRATLTVGKLRLSLLKMQNILNFAL